MNQSKHSPLTLRDVCRALSRHRRRAVAFFVASMVAATTYVVVAPRKYDSEGKLFVRLGRENTTLDPAATLGTEPVVNVPHSRKNEINSIAEALCSRPTFEEVVRTVGAAAILGEGTTSTEGSADTRVSGFGNTFRTKATDGLANLLDWVDQLSPNPAPPLSPADQAVLTVSETLSVYPSTDTSVINVSYESHDPELSRTVVDTVIDYYLKQHGRLNRNEGSHEFFARQKSTALEKLTQAENELRDLRKETGPVSLDGQREVVVERIARLEDEFDRTRSNMAESEAKVRMLREKLAAAPDMEVTAQTSGIGDQGTDDIRAQFHALRTQEQAAAAKYTEAHPRLQHIRRQVAEVRAILEREPPTRTQVTQGPGQVHQEAKLALLTEEPLLASLRAKSQALEEQLVAANAQWDRLNENDLRMAKLQRDVELYTADYRKYAANFEQTRIDEALKQENISNISILQAATYDAKPVRPRKLLALAVGFLVGTFGGLGLALIADGRRRPLSTAEQLEADLEVPALASIPRLKRKQLILNGRN